MSDDIKETVEQFKEKVAKTAETEKLRQENLAKKAILDSKRLDQQMEQMKQNEKELDIAKNANFGGLNEAQVAALQTRSADYIKAAKNEMIFICSSFNNVVPFFKKNFIFLGGKTGEGKSTAVANIAYGVLANKDPVTGKVRRVLVLTNEEQSEDFYNRVTCIHKGWHYTNHSKFTEEQIKTFNKMIPVWASGGRLTVIDNDYEGAHGTTTTIEGIEMVFENLIKNEQWYDCIIIDYYQNIISSKVNPNMSSNEVSEALSRLMDRYKNIYPAPIVMMGQVRAPTKDDKVPFKERIEGRKIILNVATFAAEMATDRENLRTQWTVWKSRFTESVGKQFFTGYDFGRFVTYTSAFAEKAQRRVIDKQNNELNKQIGIKDVFKEEKKDGNGNNSEGNGSSKT